jgi:hypothetical protein
MAEPPSRLPDDGACAVRTVGCRRASDLRARETGAFITHTRCRLHVLLSVSEWDQPYSEVPQLPHARPLYLLARWAVLSLMPRGGWDGVIRYGYR